MAEQGAGGQILNISSIFGSIGVQGRAPYNASKGGVNNLTRCLAVELAEHDIHVNALAPGFIKTALDEQTREEKAEDDDEEREPWPRYGYDDRDIQNRTPLDRFGSVEEMGNCALFLVSGDHYMTGEVMHADGGWLAFGWGARSAAVRAAVVDDVVGDEVERRARGHGDDVASLEGPRLVREFESAAAREHFDYFLALRLELVRSGEDDAERAAFAVGGLYLAARDLPVVVDVRALADGCVFESVFGHRLYLSRTDC